jgi:hypothetical protein
MKIHRILLGLLLLCISLSASNARPFPSKEPPTPRDSMVLLLENTQQELAAINAVYVEKLANLQAAINENATFLAHKELAGQFDASYLQALALKIHYLEEYDKVEAEGQFNITKTRYRKGIELIKMVYEKVLALDHHFAALQTYQNIATITNPNSYPDFQAAKALLEKKSSKSNPPFQLPALLQSNPYVSIASTLVSFLVVPGDNKEKEAEIGKIACIMDFTVRMSSDLSVINHETGFLRDHNNSLKEESLQLFDDYVSTLGYTTPLDRCRKADDWDKIYEMLDVYVTDMEAILKKTPGDKSVYKKQVNLEFAVDRLVDYINKYSNFVSQGEKYYQKFKSIVSTYENQAKCADQLPKQFEDLRKDIDISIEKFNNSYNLAELKGSKLKDLIYGSGSTP